MATKARTSPRARTPDSPRLHPSLHHSLLLWTEGSWIRLCEALARSYLQYLIMSTKDHIFVYALIKIEYWPILSLQDTVESLFLDMPRAGKPHPLALGRPGIYQHGRLSSKSTSPGVFFA